MEIEETFFPTVENGFRIKFLFSKKSFLDKKNVQKFGLYLEINSLQLPSSEHLTEVSFNWPTSHLRSSGSLPHVLICEDPPVILR